jgi:uncharacterized protein YjbI with pentapeptide repeats
MEKTNLSEPILKDSFLNGANYNGAFLEWANLEKVIRLFITGTAIIN